MTTQEHRKGRLRHLIDTDYEKNQSQMADASPFNEQGDRTYTRSRINQLAGDKEPFGEGAAKRLAESYGLPGDWFNKTLPTPLEAKKLGVRIEDGYPAEGTALPLPSVEQAFEIFARALGRIKDQDRRQRVLSATAAYAADQANNQGERSYAIQALSGGFSNPAEALAPTGTGP